MNAPVRPSINRSVVILSYAGLNVRGVSDFDIETGSRFQLTVDNPSASLKFEDWFFNNDPVLFAEVSADGKTANIDVRGEGECSVMIQGVSTIKIMVYPQRAAGFSVSMSKVENKA